MAQECNPIAQGCNGDRDTDDRQSWLPWTVPDIALATTTTTDILGQTHSMPCQWHGVCLPRPGMHRQRAVFYRGCPSGVVWGAGRNDANPHLSFVVTPSPTLGPRTTAPGASSLPWAPHGARPPSLLHANHIPTARTRAEIIVWRLNPHG